MKKLTAGIFTVLIGLCAANSADAAVASKGYADAVADAAQAAAIEAAATDATTKANAAQAAAEATAAADATSKANAAQSAAEKTASDALDAYKATQANVDSGQNTNISNLTTLVGTLPEDTTAKDVVEYINKKTEGIATDAALTELQGAVSTNTDAIATINGDANTAGSFAKAIADSINALSADNGAIKNVANALAAHEQLAEQTYATKTEISDMQVKGSMVTKTENFTEGEKTSATTYPSMATTSALIADSKADVQGQINAINDASTGILAGAKGYTDGKVSELAEGAVAANTSEISTLKGTVNDTTKGVLANAQKAADNATAISNEVSRATEAEAELQTAIDTKLTAKTSVNSGIVTTDANGNIIPVAPAACENMLNYCVLTYGRASETADPGYVWEVVTRDDEGK